MNKLALVSIALSTHNGEAFLSKQIDSILSQNYKNIELIIVDDCSTDGTIEVLNQYKPNAVVKIFQNEQRLGVIKNFEKAISLCTGEYIALSDQDDIWKPDKIEKLISKIKDGILISSDIMLINKNEKIINPSWFQHQSIYIPESNFMFQAAVYQNFALGCTMLFKRELVKYIIPIPEKSLSHDWWILVLASSLGKIKVLRESLIMKRIHFFNVSDAGEDNFIIRAKKYFIPKQRKKRVKRYRDSVNRIESYLSTATIKDELYRKYLTDLRSYYKGLQTPGIHFNSTIIAFKYRRIFYGGFNPVIRMIQIIAKLF